VFILVEYDQAYRFSVLITLTHNHSILNRTHTLLIELSVAEEALEANGQVGSANSDESKTLREQIAELKKKHLDYDTLKKQAAQQNKEFDRLADEHNALEEKSRVGVKETRKEL
jgi:hypothetical protein